MLTKDIGTMLDLYQTLRILLRTLFFYTCQKCLCAELRVDAGLLQRSPVFVGLSEVVSRSGRGKVQELWQRTPTVTSPNNRHTNFSVPLKNAQLQKKYALLTGN